MTEITTRPLRRFKWTPTTEATLAVDYFDGLDLRDRPYWPRGWQLWRQATDIRDAEIYRRMEGFTR